LMMSLLPVFNDPVVDEILFRGTSES